jgi:uncharacterized membrane protein YfcA
MTSLEVTVLVAGGVLAGIINAFAGGGSFISFPLLMWAGLPPQVANATNRVAIVLQCMTGTVNYHRHGVLPWRDLLKVVPAMILGALPGAWYASHLDEDLFRKLSAFFLFLMLGTMFIDPKKWTSESPEGGRIRYWHLPGFVLLGLYGGFLQVGIGSFILGLFVLAGGYDVVRGNALKFALAGIYNAAALVLFARSGQVNWWAGGVLAIGMMIGGAIGSQLVVLRGVRWVRYVVIASAIAAIIKLLAGI